MWALKNLAFMARPRLKEGLARTVGYRRILRLCDDPDTEVQEQALNLVRNLAFGSADDVQRLIDGAGARFFFCFQAFVRAQHLCEVMTLNAAPVGHGAPIGMGVSVLSTYFAFM